MELDAVDLAAMTPGREADRISASSTATAPPEIDVTLVHESHTRRDLDSKTERRGTKALKIGLCAGVLLAAVATGSALYTRAPSTPAIKHPALTAPPAPLPDWVNEETAVVPEPPREPVRYANPFDKSEVFEFPAGTTKEAARDQVAAMLLERGLERRANDPKLRKKRAQLTAK